LTSYFQNQASTLTSTPNLNLDLKSSLDLDLLSPKPSLDLNLLSP
jgi:hypothetical protein